MKTSLLTLMIAFTTLAGGFPLATQAQDDAEAGVPTLVQSYTIRGMKIAYYLVPKDLESAELLAAARKIPEVQSHWQILFVDDASGVPAYAAFAKAISEGRDDVKRPAEWADKHIVANIAKTMKGNFNLYEGTGFTEIGKVK